MDRVNSNLDARGLPPGYPFRADDEISPREALSARDQGAVFVDVRTQSEFDICRIDAPKGGRVLLPLQSLEARIDDLKAAVDDRLETPIVVYCHHGRRSLTATFMLRAAGFSNARSLAGGIDLWSRAVDPGVPTY